MTLDDYVQQRNEILTAAENAGTGNDMWIRLGVANRHIYRVVHGILPWNIRVEREIAECLERCRKEATNDETQ